MCILTKSTCTENLKKLAECYRIHLMALVYALTDEDVLCHQNIKNTVPSKFPYFWKKCQIPWLFPGWKKAFQFSLISRNCRYPEYAYLDRSHSRNIHITAILLTCYITLQYFSVSRRLHSVLDPNNTVDFFEVQSHKSPMFFFIRHNQYFEAPCFAFLSICVKTRVRNLANKQRIKFFSFSSKI